LTTKGKTAAEVREFVLRAIDLEAIEQCLDDGADVEAIITPDQKVRIRRNNPLQEFIFDIVAEGEAS